MSVHAKIFPRQPFKAAAGRRIPDFFGNSNPQPCPFSRSSVIIRYDMAVADALSRTRQPEEFGTLSYPVLFGKGKSQKNNFLPFVQFQEKIQEKNLRNTKKLQSQTFSALSSAALDDSLTGLALHTFPKAVCSCPFDTAGLICSFHLLKSFLTHFILFLKKSVCLIKQSG